MGWEWVGNGLGMSGNGVDNPFLFEPNIFVISKDYVGCEKSIIFM